MKAKRIGLGLGLGVVLAMGVGEVFGGAEAATVRRPAEIWWGGVYNMGQLVQPGAQWDFVKQHQDGLFLHGFWWCYVGKDQGALRDAAKLAEQLKPYKTRFSLELGWGSNDEYGQGGPPMLPHYATMRATDQVVRVKALLDAGLPIDEICVDWHFYIFLQVLRTHPDWSKRDVLTYVSGDPEGFAAGSKVPAGYWRDYLKVMTAALPGVRFNVTDSPVCFGWNDRKPFDHPWTWITPLTEYRKDGAGPVIKVDGKPVNMVLSGEEIFSAVFRGANQGVDGKQHLYGLVSDCPYSYFAQWGDQAAGRAMREDIRRYERWLHERGLKHYFICNDAGIAYEKLDHDAWDRRYAENSLRSMVLYQAEGGRADRYLFESWYDGPFSMVPETKEGTFANLALRAIKYLKGPGQALDLTIQVSGREAAGDGICQPRAAGVQEVQTAVARFGEQAAVVSLRNRGDTACMAVVKVAEQGGATSAGWQTRYQCDGRDVTDDVTGDEGLIFTGLLKPGEVRELKVVVGSPIIKGASSRSLSFSTFWNPQEYTVRDEVRWTVSVEKE